MPHVFYPVYWKVVPDREDVFLYFLHRREAFNYLAQLKIVEVETVMPIDVDTVLL